MKRSIITLSFLSFSLLHVLGLSGQNKSNIEIVKEILKSPWSERFFIEKKNDEFKMGDTISHFNNNKEFEHLTFDISNNKVLANMTIRGTLKNVTFYRDSYFANCSPTSGLTDGSWPGVWVAKDNSSYGPYSFTLEIQGKKYNLDSVDWDFKTGLLDNILPVTKLIGPKNAFTIQLVTFAPISADGENRIRGLVYGMYLENNSSEELTGNVLLPELFGNKRQDVNPIIKGNLSWALFDPYDYEMALGDTIKSTFKLPFNLKKGESIWVPVVINNLGDNALEEINQIGSADWLKQTHEYFRNMLGSLKTYNDPFLHEFNERQVMAAFGSIAMSASGKISGSNWGSYPTTRQIWMKDFYYSALPFMSLDKDLARKIILWFNEFGVRPKGNVLAGGVTHSVGISMAGIMLAGLYYNSSGDKQFFLENKQLIETWNRIISELISSRKDSDIWLFPSRYISDGYIKPDYHTGSNVCAWFAIKTYAQIISEIYNDQSQSANMYEIADNVKSAIMEKCTIDGPFGRQFIEATYRDGREAPMESDGEESDITLMPYYGFLSWDDPTYLNYMKFSVSEHNTIYQPVLNAISWFGVPSTAPGYLKGICAVTDKSQLFEDKGFITEIRRITDADGSIWWWTHGTSSNKQIDSKHVVRNSLPGKSGWFSGIYSSIFMKRNW